MVRSKQHVSDRSLTLSKYSTVVSVYIRALALADSEIRTKSVRECVFEQSSKIRVFHATAQLANHILTRHLAAGGRF